MDNTTNKKKQDFATKLLGITDKFQQFISEEFYDSSTYFNDKLEENVISLLDVEKPKVMVYGIYNSGKSTLINALCKEEVAQMANRPMTDQITEYDRGDYFLVDSPGVDAPIHHQQVTEEFINKCHIILFVISTKGVFEDRDNYVRLAKLIEQDIPFIIVLNDRGANLNREWTQEKKEQAKAEHQQELKKIQYKVIDNLRKESHNQNITDKYEVVVLNAKKALLSISKSNQKLYDISNVGFLDKRITQILQNDTSIKDLFKQPINNFNDCLNETEKIITQNMTSNSSEDFEMRLHIMASKRDNIMQELRILIKETVYSHLEELTNSYINGDTGMFETIAYNLFVNEINDIYSAKLNELLVYINNNFSSLNIYIDSSPNLDWPFETGNMQVPGRRLNFEEIEKEMIEPSYTPVKSGPLDFLKDLFKSRRKKEEEQFKRLEMEAELKNQQAQYRVQEQIRKKQEARQLASSDLDDLLRQFNTVLTEGMNEKYGELLNQIQQIDCLNKQALEDGKRQMSKLNEIRENLIQIENLLA